MRPRIRYLLSQYLISHFFSTRISCCNMLQAASWYRTLQRTWSVKQNCLCVLWNFLCQLRHIWLSLQKLNFTLCQGCPTSDLSSLSLQRCFGAHKRLIRIVKYNAPEEKIIMFTLKFSWLVTLSAETELHKGHPKSDLSSLSQQYALVCIRLSKIENYNAPKEKTIMFTPKFSWLVTTYLTLSAETEFHIVSRPPHIRSLLSQPLSSHFFYHTAQLL